jgi:hypothetical protein
LEDHMVAVYLALVSCRLIVCHGHTMDMTLEMLAGL